LSAVAHEPRYTLAEWASYHRDPTKNKDYQRNSRLGPVIRDYLAWKRHGRTAEITLDGYERNLARLCSLYPDADPDEITPARLLAYLDTFPPGSWPRVRAAVNGLFRYCLLFDIATSNPLDRLPSIKAESTKVYDIFQMTEQAKLVSAQDDSLLPERDRLGVLIFQLGVRKSEARRLQPRHFDVTSRVVFVFGKGNKERIVPFDEELWLALLEFMNAPIPKVVQTDARDKRFVEDRLPRDGDHIFFPNGATRRDGEKRLLWSDPARAMSSTAMHGWWKAAVERAEVRYRSMHMNRHTTGTNLVDADVDAFSVRDWLGHADTRTTEVYVHNSRQRLQRASDRLAVFRKGPAEGDRS